MRYLFALLAILAIALGPTPALADTLDQIKAKGEIIWGTDIEGGAPFIMVDPKDPSQATGFETEIGHALARELSVKGRFVHNAWDGLVPALDRGTFDMVMNGLEITPDREAKILFSRPYYLYTQQTVVRQGATGMTDLAGLVGKRVGTLGGTVAERLLLAQGGIDVKLYPASVQPYDDLLVGRLDAVVQDLPIAIAIGRRPGLVFAGKPFGEGYYAIGFRKGDARLKAAVDDGIGKLLVSGEMERILKRYELWNDAQAKLARPGDSGANATPPPAPKPAVAASFWAQLWDAGPLFARGTAMTIAVSTLGMALAMTLGLALAIGRVYGAKPVAWACTAYVEVFRGTPLLIQLFMIYYGLPSLGIKLDAFVAAVVGLGLNYAAYEAENYRAGLLAVPRGQVEAALALGMNRVQALRHVLLPQSLRIVIPPVTNDFIALFKDSSVVSIITMVELTKVYSMMASQTYDYIGFGLVTAAIYFAIAYPTSLFARWLEVRLRVA